MEGAMVKPSSKQLRSLCAALSLVALAGILIAAHKTLRWKRFAVVEHGKLYRSGQLAGWQLERAITKYGIRTVVSFAPREAKREHALCRRHGVAFHLFGLPADGVGDPGAYVQFLKIAGDPANQPVLVHCQAGVARTGAAVALYRQAFHGWTHEKALAELCSFERHGRCDPALQSHIAEVFAVQVAPFMADNLAARSESVPR
jgi:protein tyrosine/serine phosphatase